MRKWFKYKEIYAFGEFRLDPSIPFLRHLENTVPLTPKVLQTLLILIERRAGAVSKEELREKLWPGIFIEENALPQNIYLLRKALKEKEPDAEYIENLPRRGYRFVGKVRVLSPLRPLPWILAAGLALSALALALILGRPWTPGNRATRGTANREAYDLYLLGRTIWTKRDRDRMDQAHAYLSQAVAKDPKFAVAWAALADLYALGQSPALEAQKAARKALELDPNLAEAHTSLGFIRMVHIWDWPGAEQSFRRAIALDPGYDTARQWYALYLALCGRFAEANRQLDEGLRREPLSVNLLHERCEVLYLQKDYSNALGSCRKVLEIDPVFRFAKRTMTQIAARRGDFDWMIQRMTEGDRAREGYSPKVDSPVAQAYRQGGAAGYWRFLIDHAAEGQSYALAQYYTELGDRESALRQFSNAVDTHQFMTVYARTDPAFDPLRGDSRFQALLGKINGGSTAGK